MTIGPPPEKVYRFFDTEEHARELVGGYVNLSTFGFIRDCERARGDSKDGTLTYRSDLAWWQNGSKNAAAANLEAAGIHRSQDGLTQVFFDNTYEFRPDAYMYCTTLASGDKFRRVFGNFCVEISQPVFFLDRVMAACEERLDLETGAFFPLKYVGRVFRASEAKMPHPMWVGSENCEWEQEARFVLFPKNSSGIRPVKIYAPGTLGLCRMI